VKFQVVLEEETTMIASFPTSFKEMEALPTKTIIHSLARYAVAHDKVLETTDVAFRVDGRGNVLMVEPEKLTTHHQDTPLHREKCIVVPRQEAYERIVYATRKKMEQMRHLYEGVQKRAGSWTKISLIVVCIALLAIVLTVVAAVSLDILQKQNFWLFLFLLINMGNVMIVGYSLWQARKYSKQANIYLESYLEIENFYATISSAAQLPLDDKTRELLQEIFIAQSLGVPSKNVAVRDEGTVLFF
jgi:hypothetical protein